MNTKNKLLMSAAIAGLIGAGSLVSSTNAQAEEETGHCMGANACKGSSGCAVKGSHECKGHNGCKGKGFTSVTKAECEKISKKNKGVRFEKS